MTKQIKKLVATVAIALSLCLLGCSSGNETASSVPSEATKNGIQEEIENTQVHDYTMDLIAGYDRPDSLTEYQILQLKYPQSQRVFYTFSKNTLSTIREDADTEHDATVNSALMNIKAGRAQEVPVDGHVGALEKHVNGSGDDASYTYRVEWFVANTSYSVSFTYDGEHADQLKPYAESFYKTIKMIQ